MSPSLGIVPVILSLVAAPTLAAPVAIDFSDGILEVAAGADPFELSGTYRQDGFAVDIRGSRFPGDDPSAALGGLTTGSASETEVVSYEVRNGGGFRFEGLDLGATFYSGLGYRYGVLDANGSAEEILLSFSPALRIVGTVAGGGTVEALVRPGDFARPGEGGAEEEFSGEAFVSLTDDARFEAEGSVFEDLLLESLRLDLTAGGLGAGCAPEQLTRVTLAGFDPAIACAGAAPTDSLSFVELAFVGGRNDAAFVTLDALLVAPVAPVPLPAAGWLLLAGLGGMAAARGRRR